MLTRLLHAIGQKPPQAIEYLLAIFSVSIGAFILTPLYSAETAPALHSTVTSEAGIKIYATLLILSGLVTLFALTKSKFDKKFMRLRQGMAFFYFMYFTYFALVRIIFYGFFSLTWTMTLIVALIAGIVYLGLRLENR